MIFSTPVPSVSNTLKNIYRSGPLWDELTSEYFNDNNDVFRMLFQKYTASSVDNIYHPYIINEWKYNMDKAYYEDNHNLGVYIPSVKI